MDDNIERYRQAIAIKRNGLRNIKGCLESVATLSECEKYEYHLVEAEAVLTRILERYGLTHNVRHES